MVNNVKPKRGPKAAQAAAKAATAAPATGTRRTRNNPSNSPLQFHDNPEQKTRKPANKGKAKGKAKAEVEVAVAVHDAPSPSPSASGSASGSFSSRSSTHQGVDQTKQPSPYITAPPDTATTPQSTTLNPPSHSRSTTHQALDQTEQRYPQLTSSRVTVATPQHATSTPSGPSTHQGAGALIKLSSSLPPPTQVNATPRAAASALFTPSGPSTHQGAGTPIESSSSLSTPTRFASFKSAVSNFFTPSASSTRQGDDASTLSPSQHFLPRSNVATPSRAAQDSPLAPATSSTQRGFGYRTSTKRRAEDSNLSDADQEDAERPAKRMRGQASARGQSTPPQESRPIIHNLKKKQESNAKRATGDYRSQMSRPSEHIRYHKTVDDSIQFSDDDLEDATLQKPQLSRQEAYSFGQEAKKAATYIGEVHNFVKGKPTRLMHQRDVEKKVRDAEERVRATVQQEVQ